MDLWADFVENQHTPPDAAEQGKFRRLTESAVFFALRQWLLSDYIASYCRAIGATRIFRRCYWVDALGLDSKLAASPVLEASDIAENGSVEPRGKKRKKAALQPVPPALQPIVTLSQELAQESRPITLYGLLLAAGSSKRKEIRIAQNGNAMPGKELTLPKESGIIHASWLEAAPILLKEIDQSPAIFLLNPLGHTMFSYDDLAPLYQRSVPTELCLLLSHKQAEARLLAAQRTPAQGAALTALLRSDRWKTLPTQEEEKQRALDGLISLFLSSMQRHFLFPVQTISFPLQAGRALVENVPYTLLFATRRQDSLYCMNDAVCMHARRVTEQSHRGVLGEEWFLQQSQIRLQEELQQLQERIAQQGRQQRIRRWPDLRQQVLLANFGRFTLQEYDTIIVRLIEDGTVGCQWKRTIAEDSTKRPPGNDDLLVWR